MNSNTMVSKGNGPATQTPSVAMQDWRDCCRRYRQHRLSRCLEDQSELHGEDGKLLCRKCGRSYSAQSLCFPRSNHFAFWRMHVIWLLPAAYGWFGPADNCVRTNTFATLMAVVSLLGVVFNLIRMTARGWHRKEYMLLTPEAISWMSREIGYHEHRWANVAGVTRRRPNALPSLVAREGRSATEIAEGYLPTDMSKAEFAAILAVAHRSATATPADRPPLARHV